MKDKKQLLQLIVLGVLVAVFAGYGVMKLVGGKSSPPPAPTAKQTAAAPEGSGPTVGTEPTVPNADTQDPIIAAAQTEISTQAGHDPFSPALESSTIVPTRIARGSGGKPPASFFGGLGAVPPIGVGPGTGQIQGQAAVEEPFPAFNVTGIITGKTNVAIIRIGEGRYIVKEGQTINGSYKVASVSQDGVLMTHGARSVFLKLGGEANAN